MRQILNFSTWLHSDENYNSFKLYKSIHTYILNIWFIWKLKSARLLNQFMLVISLGEGHTIR